MRRKNAIIFSLIVIFVTGLFSFLGIRAALYGFDGIPVAGRVYGWVIHAQSSEDNKARETEKLSSRQTPAKTEHPDKTTPASSKASKSPKGDSDAQKDRQKQQNAEHKPDYIMEATAYVDKGQTKTQIYAGIGSVAVDPKIVPHGTLLYIEGYGLALATDTGRLIKGHSVDVWFADKKTAMEWGRKKVKVWKVGQADIKKILATGGKYVKY